MTNSSTPSPRPSARVADFTSDLQALWDQSVAWLATHYLQIAIATAAGAVIFAILYGLRLLGARLCRDRISATQWSTVIGRAVAKTRFWFMVALAARLVSGMADPPQGLANLISVVFTVASALQAAIWARELVLGAVEHRAGPDLEHGRIGSAMGIIRLLVTFALFAIAGVLILDNLGVNVTGLIAGLGIGGIAIGLAAQGIFADLFAALSIIFDKPFRRGDSIKYDQTSGSVEAIGLKSTRIRALSGEQVVIANRKLLDKELHNYANLDRRRMTFLLGLTYETPADMLAKVPDIVRDIVASVDKCSLVRCGLVNFNDSSVDFEVQFDVHSEVYNEVYDARTAVGLAILKRFAEAGLPFAYPTQLSYFAGPDAQLVPPYPDVTLLAHEEEGMRSRPAANGATGSNVSVAAAS